MDTDCDYFLSYSRYIYKEFVVDFVNMIEQFGLKIWLDKTEVTLGCNIYSNLYNILEKAKSWHGAIIIIDSSYLEKEWCNLEAKFFISNNIKCVPLLYKITKQDLPFKFRYFKSLNIATIPSIRDIDNAVDKILMSYIHDLPVQKLKTPCQSKLLYELKNYYDQCSVNSHHFIFTCEIISQIFEGQFPNIRGSWQYALTKLIHNKVQKLYNGAELSHYETVIVHNATDYILSSIKFEY